MGEMYIINCTKKYLSRSGSYHQRAIGPTDKHMINNYLGK